MKVRITETLSRVVETRIKRMNDMLKEMDKRWQHDLD